MYYKYQTKVFFARPCCQVREARLLLKKHEVFSTSTRFLKRGAQPLIPITPFHREVTFTKEVKLCFYQIVRVLRHLNQVVRNRMFDHGWPKDTVLIFFQKNRKKH